MAFYAVRESRGRQLGHRPMISLPLKAAFMVDRVVGAVKLQTTTMAKCIFSTPASILEATYLPEVMRNPDLRAAAVKATGRTEEELAMKAASEALLSWQ